MLITVRVQLQNNEITGVLPEFTSPLQFLNLSKNNLGSTIPLTLMELPSLKHLYLSNNDFTGNIPEGFGKSSSLEYIHLDGNQLNGEIPDITDEALLNISKLSNEKPYP